MDLCLVRGQSPVWPVDSDRGGSHLAAGLQTPATARTGDSTAGHLLSHGQHSSYGETLASGGSCPRVMLHTRDITRISESSWRLGPAGHVGRATVDTSSMDGHRATDEARPLCDHSQQKF